MKNIGDQAPEFSLPDAEGQERTLSGLLADGDLILYFYPADFTPVCTAEACVFRDNYEGVEALGLNIVGVSPQSTASHRSFIDRYDLPFPLLSDMKKEVIRAYGADGPFGFGVRRVTYLIDQSAVIQNRVVADFSAASHLQLLKDTVAERHEGG